MQREDAETPAEYFERAAEAFGQACRPEAEHTRDFRIGGRHVRVHLAGPDLVRPLTRALDHLRIRGDGEPDLSVMAWAAEAAPAMPPPLDWKRADIGAHGVIGTLTDTRFSAAWMYQAGGLQMFDRQTSRAVYWVRDAADLPYWETGAPMRILLGWWAANLGLLLVHAAVVGDQRGAVLLAGRGGAGKSTTALGCLEAGLSYLSDDYVLLDPDGWVAHGLYCSGKLDRAGLERLPFLAAHVANAGRLEREKALLFIHEALPSQMLCEPLPVRALVSPRIDVRAQTDCRPTTPGTALKALAPSSMLQSPGVSGTTLQALARLTRACPCFQLTLGADTGPAPALLSALLPELKATRRPLVSVIVPVHDPGPHLGPALDSVVAQRHVELELIVIDDGSTEDIGAVLDRLSGKLELRRVRQEQRGPSAARNRGVQLARGELIGFLDADDLWPAGSLAARIAVLQEAPEAEVVQGQLRNLLEASEPGSQAACFGPPRRSFNLGSMLFRRQVFERAGLLDEELHHSEDVDFLVRLAEHGLRRRLIDTVCLFYRRYGGGIIESMNSDQRGRAHMQAWARILKSSLDRRRADAKTAPTVSVIVVVQNGARYLAGAIDSVLAQARSTDLPDLELIVVDGDSTDRSVEIAQGYPGVRVVQQPGEGLADARNAGVAAARGEWVAFLDHDDEWTPDKLTRQLAVLEAMPEARYSLGKLMFFVEAEAAPAPGLSHDRHETPRPGPTPGTLLAQRALFDEIGGFDQRYAIGCDLEWLQRARDLEVPCAECDAVLLRKRLRQDSLSRQALENRREIFQVLREKLSQRRR